MPPGTSREILEPTSHGSESASMDKLIKFWPVFMGAIALVATGAVAQFQITAMAGEVEKHEELIEENEDSIEAIQRKLIERQGSIQLDLERLRIQQSQQSQKLDDVLRLLKAPSNP